MAPVNDDESHAPVRLLKGGAALFAILGLVFAGWALDTWWDYPNLRASQFGFEAPLWPALVVFVVVATAAGVFLLWRTAQRVERGEDLFEKRHRRRPENDQSSGSPQ